MTLARRSAARARATVLLTPAAGLLLAACGGGGASAATPTPSPPPASWSGATLVNPVPKPEFTLTDQAGRPFDFRAGTAGKVTLLYFGYTHCPDLCPTDMLDTSIALRDVPADVRQRIAVVFVTTDPARDTPPVLGAWLQHFDPTFIGLTGTLDQVRAAQRQAGVFLASFEPVSGATYGVDHAAYVLAYTADGLAHISYPDGVKPADEARDLVRLVRTGYTG